MPNLTTSSIIDTFLGATDLPTMQSSIGLSGFITGGAITLNGNLSIPTSGTAALLSNPQTFTAANIFSGNAAPSTPLLRVVGNSTTGTSTTAKPLFLIEPTGVTSNNWATAGTIFGINYLNGYAGRIISIQNNGTEVIYVRNDGKMGFIQGIGASTIYDQGLNSVLAGQGTIASINGLYANALQINGPSSITNSQALSSSGSPTAVNLTTTLTKLTTTGAAQALTLADGTDGQLKIIIHTVAGGSAILTPTTKTGFSTITFSSAGDTAILIFSTTIGWTVLSSRGATVA